MRKYLYIAIVLGVLMGVIGIQTSRIKSIKTDRDRYRNNMSVLIEDIERYKTKEGHNVISTRELSLKLSEYKKYRAEDTKIIKSLKNDIKGLRSVLKTQSRTMVELEGQIRDSIVYRDNYIIDTMRCVDIVDKWFELHGCANRKDSFSGTFISRDSLYYVEHVEYKRFLGFLWRTKKIKDRKQTILNKNPHTEIIDAEFVTIRE